MSEFIAMRDPCEHVSRIDLIAARLQGDGDLLDELLEHLEGCGQHDRTEKGEREMTPREQRRWQRVHVGSLGTAIRDLDAEATRLTGITLVDGSQVFRGLDEVGCPEQWGDPADWQPIESAVTINRTTTGWITSRRLEGADMYHDPDLDYQGQGDPEDDVATDQQPVNLTDQNSVEAEAGTKAAVMVRLPGGETLDAFTVVSDAFHGPVRTLDPAVVPSAEAVIIRRGLANLVISGYRDADGFWQRNHVLPVGRFGVSATEYRNAEGYIDTLQSDCPHLVWVLVPKGHELDKHQGVKGVCIRFLPDSADPAILKDGSARPRLDHTTIVGYTKFFTASECEAHQERVVRSLDAIHRATTDAQRSEDQDGPAETVTEKAWSNF